MPELERKWKKALLVVPPTGKYIREERCQTPIDELHTVVLRPPMDLLYIGGALGAIGVQCKVIDCPALDATWDDFENELRDYEPDVLLLSITTPTLDQDLKAASIAKRIDSEIITISKGAHFLHLDQQTLEQNADLDLVIRGEYEETIKDLASGVLWSEIDGITYQSDSGVKRNQNRGFILNIDSIAFPARNLIDNAIYCRPDTGELQTTIVTSRGCPYSCIYCLAQLVAGKSVRNRSPENVVAELKECIELHNIHDFLFRSDLFTANKKWVIALCKAIQDAGLKIKWSCNSRVDTLSEEMLCEMKKAGCWLIAFGVEHGDPKMLELMRKQVKYENIEPAIRTCRQSGIKSSVYLLIGLPWESRETFEKTKDISKRLDPDFIEFFYTYPFYGTEFYRIAVEEGLLEDGVLPDAGYNQPAIPTKYLSLEELKPMRREALREFYFRPGYILRTLASNPSPKVLKNYLVFGLRQLRDLLKKK